VAASTRLLTVLMSATPDPGNKPSRRDLLGGSLPQRRPTAVTPGDRAEYGPLFHFSSNAMGCEFQVLCTAEGRQPLAHVVAEAFDLIQHLEQQLSIYRSGSEMSRINRTACPGPVPVESRLFALLQLATNISEATGGAFDITATPLSQLWKQHRQQGRLPDARDVRQTLGKVGYQQVHLQETGHTIRFSSPDVVLDLGGIGKGYALDRMKELLVDAGCQDFLVHGGQSSVIAHGRRANRAGTDKHPWQVAIAHPLTPGVRLARLNLHNQAIGTSGSGRQFHIVDGKRYGHIIDPRTGWPADGLLSVTVIAEAAVLADALATAIFVAGAEAAPRICQTFQVAAVVITGQQQMPVITPINLPPDQIEID
jgi:thiamine biosynthesis lipoprotein